MVESVSVKLFLSSLSDLINYIRPIRKVVETTSLNYPRISTIIFYDVLLQLLIV